MINGNELYNTLTNELNILFDEKKETLSADDVHNKYADVINTYCNNNADVIVEFTGTNPSGTPITIPDIPGELNLTYQSTPSPDVAIWKNKTTSSISLSMTKIDETLGYNPFIISMSTAPSISIFNYEVNPNSNNHVLDFCDDFIEYIKSLTNAQIPASYGVYTGVLTVSSIS